MFVNPAPASSREMAMDASRARYANLRSVHAGVVREIEKGSPKGQALLSAAAANISKWEARHTCSPLYINLWRRILKHPQQRIRSLVQNDSDTADSLLQNTPFSSALRDLSLR
jgi:hypothetical protein